MKPSKHWFIAIWKTIVFLTIVYVAVSIPIELCFHHNYIASAYSKWLISIVFFLDLLLNIKRIKKERKNIECREIENKEWYQYTVIIADLLAALPIDLLFPLPVFKLLRLLKLVRLHHIQVGIQHSMIQYAGTFTFITFAFWFALILNALACGWQGLQLTNSTNGFLSDYINALYWTITTVTTVGYGDITPVSNVQKLYSIFVQILGFGVFTFVIGTVASRLVRKDPARLRFEENVDGLVSLMHFKSLPAHLRDRVMDYYKYMWRNRLGYDETAFLQSLPDNLQTEVALHLKRDIIDKVSIFKDTETAFKREIALLLKPVFITPDNYVFKAGDEANSMYFVVNGELITLSESEDRELTQLRAGDYFGEIALLKNKRRSATIKALTYCDLYALNKKAFEQVYNKYPDVANTIRATVEERERNYSA
ncbi:MAG: cyclic nucleotide-binding domain-containing protein [Carboxylicivirga sp.]|jgi:voltage-gated potassium channel|nr:cyclic nucleotide-binding domain-containing protein [Carboxylicivirga sp.]